MLKRIASILVVAAALAASVVWAPAISLQIGELPNTTTLDVKARDLSLVCVGGAYKATSKLGEFEQIGSPLISSQFNGSASTSLSVQDGVYTVSDPAGSDAQGSALLNVNQVQALDGATLAGLSGTACQRATQDLWLVGGDTRVGREALLILKNPTTVDSTVDLQVFSEGGLVDAPGLTGISVIGGKTTIIPLSGLIPKTTSFATHVTAKGGAIAAWIQQRTVHGLTASGFDYISPSPQPAKQQVIPGVLIRGAKLAKKLIAADADYGDLQTVLRVYVPGAKSATVTAQLVGSTAKTFGTVIQATVQGGSVIDLPFGSVADGDYAVLVNSNVKVQTALRLSRVVSAKAPDFAWLAAAEGSSALRKISVPVQGISKLAIYNQATQSYEVNLATAGSTVSLGGTSAALFANLIVDVDGSVAGIAVLDQRNSGGKVAVSVR
ncbi:DUF5719 family protein [Rhodoluna sp.]|uniref:DUF5719 family protein n=1 Tax=Rhodoluna sp. TaxID=1969481 RepID=UPI0025D04F0E|nr:DUF5719 family protein [Rhodoluna sp.]